MVEKWGQITHILEKENREFKETMKGQVGVILSGTNSSDKVRSCENVYWDWFYCPVYNRKKAKIQTIPASKQHSFLSRVTHYYILSLLRGWSQALAQCRLPYSCMRRKRVSYPARYAALKIPINKRSGWYLPLLAGVFQFLHFTKTLHMALFLCFSLSSEFYSSLQKCFKLHDKMAHGCLRPT